jgi:hypothetical protein
VQCEALAAMAFEIQNWEGFETLVKTATRASFAGVSDRQVTGDQCRVQGICQGRRLYQKALVDQGRLETEGTRELNRTERLG